MMSNGGLVEGSADVLRCRYSSCFDVGFSSAVVGRHYYSVGFGPFPHLVTTYLKVSYLPYLT